MNNKEENIISTVEKPDKRLLNQGTLINITKMRHYQHAPPDKMKEGYDFSSLVFLPKKKNFNLITRINHITTN